MTVMLPVLLLCLHAQSLRAQTLQFDHLSIPEGLSSNSIYTIFQDRRGVLWFGTLDGLDRYDGYGMRIFERNIEDSTTIPINRVTFIFEDNLQRLWLYDEFTSTLVRYDQNAFRSYSLDSIASGVLAMISNAFETSGGELYFVAGSRTVIRYNPEKDSFNLVRGVAADTLLLPAAPDWSTLLKALDHYLVRTKSNFTAETLSIKKIIRDSGGRYWIATKYDGLYSATGQRGNFEFISHKHTLDKLHKIEAEEINDIYEDASNVVWIGTKNHGLYRYTPYKYKFNRIDQVDVGGEKHPIGTVRAICQDEDNTLWVGTNEQGLLRIEPSFEKGDQYLPQPGNKFSLGSRFIRSLRLDKNNDLWIGYYGGFSQFRRKSNDFRQHVPSIESDEEIRVYDFQQADDNVMWIAGWDVILKYYQREDRYDFIARSRKDTHDFENENIRELVLDDEGELWIAGGEKGLSIYNKVRGRFENIHHDPHRAKGLPTNNIFDIHKDTHSNIWLATTDGLCLFDVKTRTCTTYTTNDGLPSNMIFGILEDKRGFLWLSTTKGLSRFDPLRKIARNYDVSDGLQSNEFTENAFYKNKNGTLFFGGINGVNYFNPDYVPDNENPPKLAITQIKVYDKPLKEVATLEEPEIQRRIADAGEIVLRADQRSVSFEFVAYHYVQPMKNMYAFMLEGFDNGWTYRNANARFANYTNLESGTYYFLLKASNSDGVWTTEPLRVKIVIEPPFYTTAWFIILCILVISTASIWAYRSRIATLKHQQSMKSIQLESELNFLKSQVNPHFLFNTLNNIYSLCQVNSSNAAPMVGKVSEMMRYMIYDCNVRFVPLQKEIEYLQNYIGLNQLKTNKKLNVTFHVEGSTAGLKIAPLLLINFLENSFKHGDIHANGDGFITVEIAAYGTDMTLLIANSFKTKPVNKHIRRGIGIENVEHRLNLLYPDKYSLRIEKNNGIFEVELKLELD